MCSQNFIVGCRTLENELLRAIDECDCTYDVKWVESGLHNVPKKLSAALQDVLDTTAGYTRALIAMGYCGNALAGLQTRDMALIIPRTDDCISLLLGTDKGSAAVTKSSGAYFMTEGWLRGERSIWREYEYTVKKYGEKTGKEIFDAMFGHYGTLAVLDTGCFDMASVEAEMREIADALKLEYKVAPATIDYIKLLLTGPWDSDMFLTIPPQCVITQTDLM